VRERIGKAEENARAAAIVRTVDDLDRLASGRGETTHMRFERPRVIRAAIDHPTSA